MKTRNKTDNLNIPGGVLGEIVEAGKKTQACPNCNRLIGIMPGSRDAICKNCGYKDPCCD